jgi:hypothetical protein
MQSLLGRLLLADEAMHRSCSCCQLSAVSLARQSLLNSNERGALTARVPVILTVGALVVNIMLSGRLVEGAAKASRSRRLYEYCR